jgi:50S ribosomal subunit-associated GTPase HflX
VGSKARLLALNKVDLLAGEDGAVVQDYDEAQALIVGAGAPPRNVVIISAGERWGLGTLKRRIEEALDGGLDADDTDFAEIVNRAV